MRVRFIIFLSLFALADFAAAQSRNLAPGFTALPKGAKVVIMPTDIELFVISGGGVPEPKADWTESAAKHFKTAIVKSKHWQDLTPLEVSESNADELAEINGLHAAVARSIAMHHFGTLSLPTKDGKLDWSMGEAVRQVKQVTGADYAVFSWVRDSYASAERAAAMVAISILSLGRAVPQGGQQVGYASLVDLNTGQVLWFNRLARNSGDLREADPAAETLNALLNQFPTVK
jgi:hypothetical protein